MILTTNDAPVQPAQAPDILATEPQTVLDQVISGLVWNPSFQFGEGVNAITGSECGSAVKPFVPQKYPVKSSAEQYRFIRNDSEFEQEVETDVSGKYNIGGVALSASAKYLNKIKYSQLSITLLADYSAMYNGYDEMTSYELTDAAKPLLAAPDKFRAAYGDYFVAGCQRGSRFTGIYTCQATSVKSLHEFQTSFKGEAPDVFSAKGSAKFMQSATQYNITISAYLYMDGIPEGTSPGGPSTPEEIVKALTWFKANEQGTPLRAKLKHYSTIFPTYPQTIGVSPLVFAELRQLFTKVWTIRSRYQSCPNYYQQQFLGQYTELTTGVTASQDVLITDAGARKDFGQKAVALLAGLNAVLDRMEFYLKVKEAVGTEPAQGAYTEEGGGQQMWLYGYSVCTKSAAVTIHSNRLNCNESWDYGHRDHSFTFGPDQNYVVVGWQVISNWTDGTNGQWKKDIPQILLTNQAVVHVESMYDRGFDWSFIVYYVDAKDYQF